MYQCVDNPRHYAAWVDICQYKTAGCGLIYGGVNAFTTTAFVKINGYSNKYWGWGGEDDDLLKRVKSVGYKLMRPSSQVTRYTMMKHHRPKNSQPNPNRFRLIDEASKRWNEDGLKVSTISILIIC